jgi:putative copper export protein
MPIEIMIVLVVLALGALLTSGYGAGEAPSVVIVQTQPGTQPAGCGPLLLFILALLVVLVVLAESPPL